MPTRARSHFPDPPPAEAAEWSGRVLLTVAFVALAFGLASPLLSDAVASRHAQMLILMRIGVFGLGALAAATIQGARPRTRDLMVALVTVLGLMALLRALAPHAALLEQAPGSSEGLWIGTTVVLGRLEASMLAAVFLGTLMARCLDRPGHLLVVVLCAAAGDAWLNVLQVPESVGGAHPIAWLRLPFPPSLGSAATAPTFVELTFLALYLESARRFRFHQPSVLFGALTAYTVASMMAAEPWQVMLTLPLVGLGVLMGAWPDFRCTAQDVIRAFACALVLFLALYGLTLVRRSLHPPPPPRRDPGLQRNVAQGERVDLERLDHHGGAEGTENSNGRNYAPRPREA